MPRKTRQERAKATDQAENKEAILPYEDSLFQMTLEEREFFNTMFEGEKRASKGVVMFN